MTGAQVHSSPPESKLDSLAFDAASDGGDSKGFMNPKRGRPKGSKNKVEELRPQKKPGDPPTPEENILAIKQVLKPCLQIVSHAGVQAAENEQAAIGPEQMTILLNSGAACIQQYLPGALSAHMNLIIFSVTFSQWALGVYMLRQAKLAELKAEYLRQQMANGVPTPSQGIAVGH